MVSSLINPSLHCWKRDMLTELFDDNSVQAISRIPIPWRQMPDKLIWTKDHKVMFSVKSAYSVSQAHSGNSNTSNLPWQKLWKIKVHERVKMLLGGLEVTFYQQKTIFNKDWG